MNSITSSSGTTGQPHSTRRRKGLGFWLRRVLLGLVIILVALATMGAIYQAVATAIDQRTYPLSDASTTNTAPRRRSCITAPARRIAPAFGAG
jgi:hypothetical protein